MSPAASPSRGAVLVLVLVVVAILSIVAAVGAAALIGRAFDLSVFIMNMIVMVGLAAGIDYDQIPLDIVPMPDEGYLILDVSEALRFWHGRGEPNYGVVIMMSEDSHNWAHHWVYLSEQPAPADRPTLRIAYEGVP